RAEGVRFDHAAPIWVQRRGPLFSRADAFAPMVLVRKASARPADVRDAQRLERRYDVITDAARIGNIGVGADPNAFINAAPEVLGELAEDMSADRRSGLRGIHHDLDALLRRNRDGTHRDHREPAQQRLQSHRYPHTWSNEFARGLWTSVATACQPQIGIDRQQNCDGGNHPCAHRFKYPTIWRSSLQIEGGQRRPSQVFLAPSTAARVSLWSSVLLDQHHPARWALAWFFEEPAVGCAATWRAHIPFSFGGRFGLDLISRLRIPQLRRAPAVTWILERARRLGCSLHTEIARH